MKKTLIIFFSFCSIIAVSALLIWGLKSSFTAQILSQHLGNVNVSIQSLELTRTQATINRLIIGNPPRFQSAISCSTGFINIISTFKQLRSNPLIIDEIRMQDIFINIENRKDGKTNWNLILADGKKQRITRHYLIKLLILRNLNVKITQADGQVKTFPAIKEMQFQNISDDTGFPVSEIEKAIFNQVIKELYQKFSIDKVLQPLIPGMKNLPNGIMPSLFQ